MSERTIAFRVESNKKKSSFWYTLVSGNGNTTMTSKVTYSNRGSAKRAAQRQIQALLGTQLVLEYEDADGRWVRETEDVVVSASPVTSAVRTAQKKTVLPVPSTVPFEAHMNPNV